MKLLLVAAITLFSTALALPADLAKGWVFDTAPTITSSALEPLLTPELLAADHDNGVDLLEPRRPPLPLTLTAYGTIPWPDFPLVDTTRSEDSDDCLTTAPAAAMASWDWTSTGGPPTTPTTQGLGPDTPETGLDVSLAATATGSQAAVAQTSPVTTGGYSSSDGIIWPVVTSIAWPFQNGPATATVRENKAITTAK